MTRRFKANITNDELKTIMATSAIAAAGAAVATALVTYALDRWVLKAEAAEGPTFVVVPVVDREVPPLSPPEPQEPPPVIAGYGRSFGALSPQQEAQARSVMPRRYWEEFYQCWDEENPRYAADCKTLTDMYDRMGDDDQDSLVDIVSGIPNVGKAEATATMLATAGAGVAVGMLIAMAITS